LDNEKAGTFNKHTMKRLLIATALIATVAAAQAADVKELWDKNCTKCHGADGRGRTKMGQKLKIRDLTDAKVQAELKDDKMFDAIKNGVKDGDKVKMKAAEGMSDADIKALVAHARSLKK